MVIAHKLKLHPVCICRHVFRAACKIKFFNISVDFQKNALTSLFLKKYKTYSMDLGRTFPVSNFLKSVTSTHCSYRRSGHSGSLWTGFERAFNTAIYGNIVRCSLKSFE